MDGLNGYLKVSPPGTISTISIDRTQRKKIVPAKDNNPEKIYTRPCVGHDDEHLFRVQRFEQVSTAGPWKITGSEVICPLCWEMQDLDPEDFKKTPIQIYKSSVIDNYIVKVGYRNHVFKYIFPTKNNSITAAGHLYVSPCVSHPSLSVGVQAWAYGSKNGVRANWVNLLNVKCCPFCWEVVGNKEELVARQEELQGEKAP